MPDMVDVWNKPLAVMRNHFVHKSLSSWACNIAVGCEHACRFCYVPDVSTRKLGPQLAKYGVSDPDAQWGQYVLLRPYDANYFARTVATAEKLPAAALNADGNRAVMFCTTTDPYQTLKHADATRRAELNAMRRSNVRAALLAILNHSTLNVRILTRSPLAREDFDIMARFGPRLLFGMSIPTLDNKLAKIYEPDAPAPSRRLETLIAARRAGLHTFVAVAPTYPEHDFDDIVTTMKAVAEAEPVTVFAEPINIRAENVERIRLEGERHGVTMRVDVFKSPATWALYSLKQLHECEAAASVAGLASRLHLWPDAGLGSKAVRGIQRDATAYDAWLRKYWDRVSEWPKN